MNNTETYLVTCIDGDVLGEKLTTEQCAIALLTYDGYMYEIDKTEFGWELLISSGSRFGSFGLGKFRSSSLAPIDPELSAEQAQQLIFAEVVKMSGDWYPDLMVELPGAGLKALTDDLSHFSTKEAIDALEDGEYLSHFAVTQDEVEELHDGFMRKMNNEENA